MRQKKKLKIYGAIRIVLCLLVLFLIVFPFVWLILSTFKLQKDIIKWPPTIWPKAWTIKNYIKVWSRIPLASYIKNTVIFAGAVSVSSAMLDSLAGYAFARLEFKGKEIIFNIVLLTMLIAIPFGILSAVKHNKWIDYLIRFFSFIGNSMPNFFAALVLMYFFSIRLGWLPVITSDNIALSLILPTLTLAISMASKYTRQVRATILEELNKDYVAGARARGVRGSVIIWKNVMKSSMFTIITLLALSIGNLLGGTTIVETIFMWDGVGKMAVDAITMRDYPIIQAYVAWMAIIYVVVNLITDIIYHYLDPRVRLGGDRA